MKRISALVGLVTGLVMVLLLASMLVSAQENGTNVRIAHFSPDAPAVDVYVNGEVAFESVEFGSITEFAGLDAGTYTIAVAAAGTSAEEAVIGPADLTFNAGSFYTVAAVGSLEAGTLFPQVVIDDYSGLADGQARITTFHAIEGAPIVDVRAGGGVVVDGLAFPGTVGNNDGAFAIDVPAGSYDLTITPDGSAEPVILSAPGFEAAAGTFYFVAAIGTPDAPSVAVASYMMPAAEDAAPAVEEDDAVTIADVVIRSSNAQPPQFTTLLAAVQAADPSVLAALNDPAQSLTVFAPSDLAFDNLRAELGEETFNSILADPALLTQILTYHVVPQALDSTAVLGLLSDNGGQVAVTTLEGSDFVVNQNENGIFLNNAPLRVDGGLDFLADNGVIHIIDAVLVPQAVLDQLAAAAPAEEEPAGATSEQIQSATDRIFSLGSSDEAEEGEAAEEEAAEEMVEEEPLGATSEEIQSAADRIFSLGGDDEAAEGEEGTEGEASEEEAAAPSLADLVIASANGDPAQFTTLLAAVSAADPAILEALRNPDAGVTVFAPTDAAFAALAEAVGQETFDAILADQALLTQILQYHVVPQVVDSATVVELLESSEGEVVTETLLEGATLTITSTDEGIFINDAPLLLDAVDITASNGIIHTIDGVLVPQSVLDALAAPAEEEMVEEEPAGATSEEIQSAADRIFSLGSSDEAAEGEGEGEEEAEEEAAEEMVEEEPLGATSEEIQSAADRIFSLGNDDGMEDMEAEEESSDMGAAGTIVDIAAGDENFSTLVLVLTEAAPEYVELLSDPNASYTVFAPTNAAFDELAEGLGVPIEDALAFPDILADILAYHVVEGVVPAETVLTLDGQEVVTVQGESILVTIDGENVLLNGDVTVSATDVFASNGVIHVIDSVMLPESTIATLQSLGLNP